MSIDRTAWRNVHLHDASNGTVLGGFYQSGSVTESNLIWILEAVLLIAPEGFTIQHRQQSRNISTSNNPVVPGDYDIYSTGTIHLNDEPWCARIISHSESSREDSFREGVRERDGKCVITGEINDAAQWGVWSGFHAIHVFPLEKESIWIQEGYSRWITNTQNTVGNTKINSVQNGLLMAENMHSRFDQYLFSINPDDGYKIVTFMPNRWGIDGRVLDPVCRDPQNPDRVSDHVLRWHFRQCVLGNMRGAGEPVFESDFPPGSDMMATLRAEPYGKERFEMELSRRLEFGEYHLGRKELSDKA